MPKHKKKFISKDKSVTFHLVHRSQQDPLITDEKAPQHVLVPAKKKSDKSVEEEHKYGIFFDDDYDYLQHLRGAEDVEVHWEQAATNRQKKVQLPSSVFASEVEESVGLLNKAAPDTSLRLDLDADIVAAMDDDFDYEDPENQLEDDFIALANEGEDSADSEDDFEDDEDELGSLPEEFGDFETKSRFTEYSMSSSVMRRNEQLSLLDDRFEKMFEVYDKGEIGALDCEEIEGDISFKDPRLTELADEFAKKTNAKLEREDLKEKILSLVDKSDEEEEYETIKVENKSEKWDCESILSTYSNIYNHPAKIPVPRKIKVNKSGVAVEELDGRNGRKLTARNLAALDNENVPNGPKSIISMVSELSIRPKGETAEERRVRKANLREYRRERRIERKANTAAFTEEKLRQEKVLLNLKNNLTGVKIL